MNIPKDIKSQFDSILIEKKITEKKHNFYSKAGRISAGAIHPA